MRPAAILIIILALLAISPTTDANLVAQWHLKTSLTLNGTNWGPVTESVTGTEGRPWGYGEGDDLTHSELAVLGNPGPLGGRDYAYDFAPDSAITPVATNVSSALPATADFTLLAWIKTSNEHISQGHVFSNNNWQAGRAALSVRNGHDQFRTDGFQVNAGPIISTTSINDDVRRLPGVARHNGTFILSVDGNIEDYFNAPSISIEQNTMSMIGRQRRQRGYAGDYEGLVGDVHR